jgi:2-hydroxychromene-2-carboxylate isomerase
MPSEIVFCSGDKCPLKQQCVRYTTRGFGRQDFFVGVPYNFQTEDCDYFLPPYRPTEAEIRMRAYYLWAADGGPEGKSLDYWLQACREMNPPQSG